MTVWIRADPTNPLKGFQTTYSSKTLADLRVRFLCDPVRVLALLRDAVCSTLLMAQSTRGRILSVTSTDRVQIDFASIFGCPLNHTAELDAARRRFGQH